MIEKRWTKEQQNAIDSREGTVLVSAAAGSGKTAVLVQRVIERITDDKNPCDADKLLVVTFTKAAALEMKNRISQKISEMIDNDPYNMYLRKQQILLTKAHISTIHSFCSEIVRENFYKLNISKDFKIADTNEMTILREEALQYVLLTFYEKENEEFMNFVETFSTGKDDSKLANIINTLYDFIRSHPFPELWLNEKASMYEEKENILNTLWGQTILKYAQSAINYCIDLTQNSLAAISEDITIENAYKSSFLADLLGLKELQNAIYEGSWDSISNKVTKFEFEKLKPLRGYKDDQIKIRVCSNRDEVKSTIKKLAKLFYSSEDRCLEDISKLCPIIHILFEVVIMFSKKLDELKLIKCVADFGDLEHWMIKLLVEPDNKGGYVKTEIAKILSEEFKEIMVDEYQDTNEAQDIIFRALSKDESNLFLVGDVKQSIYRFRQAMPEIFLKKKEKYDNFIPELKNYPAKIILDKNFRSRSEVTNTVNFIFRQIMSKQVGQIDYNNEEQLIPAAAYNISKNSDTIIDIIDLSKSETEDMDIVEARHISKVILKMISEGYKIKDGDGERPVTYKDFCILIRSANKHASTYAHELQLNSIPAWSDVSGSFFETVEVSVMLSLLKVIDNPVNDIAILSVLLSPIFGFTPDKLSEIRLVDKSLPLYFAVKKLAELGDTQCNEFIYSIEDYRKLSLVLSPDKLIDYIYEKSGYSSMIQTMDNGHLRLANLRLLTEYAKNYGQSGSKTLSGFIRFIKKLEHNKTDIAAANTVNENANVVKIMSIHRSKGLEFPICIIAGCSRKFNMDKDEILIHPSLGLGIKLRNNDNIVQYTTMSREAVSIEIENDNISEELRILYVAMTRAKEKLILVNSVKDIEKTLKKLSSRLTNTDTIPSYIVRNASSFSDWIISCALRHPSGSQLRKIAGDTYGITVKDSNIWNIRLIYDNYDLDLQEDYDNKNELVLDKELIDKIDKRFKFVYSKEKLKNIPNKVSASIISSNSAFNRNLKRPEFIKKKGLSSREKGLALHNFMQFADYKSVVLNPNEELKRLVDEGFMTTQQSEAVDISKIREFFNSKLAERILKSNKVVREFRFTVDMPAEQICADLVKSNENIILQGAVDCAFIENDEIVIVDYKTGNFMNTDVEENYLNQLKLYRYAMEKCMNKKVKECIIYSFAYGKAISIQ